MTSTRGDKITNIMKLDMLPALDNFVSYGSEMLIQNPAYLGALVSMVEDIFHDEKVGGVDRICGCKLAEALMLNLRGFIDQYVPIFIELAMNVLNSGDAKTKSYRVHLMEMVINAIYYNPALTLQILEVKGWTNKFFSAWFSNIDSFRRVHDKKLSIVAISSLLTLKAGDVPASVQQGWPRLLQGVTKLFQTLPAALHHREAATRESDYAYDDEEDDAVDGDTEWDGEVEWNDQDEAEGGGDDDVADENAAYLDFLSAEVNSILLNNLGGGYLLTMKQAQKFGSFAEEDDDDLDEESLLETPLDKIEPYGLFKNVMLGMFLPSHQL